MVSLVIQSPSVRMSEVSGCVCHAEFRNSFERKMGEMLSHLPASFSLYKNYNCVFKFFCSTIQTRKVKE